MERKIDLAVKVILYNSTTVHNWVHKGHRVSIKEQITRYKSDCHMLQMIAEHKLLPRPFSQGCVKPLIQSGSPVMI